jgi:hypothetical protein
MQSYLRYVYHSRLQAEDGIGAVKSLRDDCDRSSCSCSCTDEPSSSTETATGCMATDACGLVKAFDYAATMVSSCGTNDS